MLFRSRNLKDKVNDIYNAICNYFDPEQINLIVSGGAMGIDSEGEKAANQLQIPFKKFLPDWEKFGKSAGFKRNELIINEATHVLALWYIDPPSKGTRHSINIALKQGKPVIILPYVRE